MMRLIVLLVVIVLDLVFLVWYFYPSLLRLFKRFKNNKSPLPSGAKHLLCLSNNRDLYYFDDTIYILKRDGSLEKKNISDFSHESIDIARTKKLHPEYCLFCNE